MFDFDQHPYAFDGVGVNFDLDFASIMGFGVKGEDDGGTSPATKDPEAVYYGLTVDLKNLPDALNMAHLHYLMINVDPESAAQNAFRGNRYGITLGGAMSGFDYRATYAAIAGDLRNNDGDSDTDWAMDSNMYDIGVGYTMENMMGLRLGVTYHSDTGNDTEAVNDDQEYGRYDGFYYDQHKFAGLMDLFTFGNLTYTGVTLTLMPQEDLTVGAGYYMFNNTSTDDQSAYTDRRSAVGGLTAGDEIEAELGNEIDVWVEKSYEGGFTIRARYGQFTPGAFFDDSNDAELTDAESQGMIQATMMF